MWHVGRRPRIVWPYLPCRAPTSPIYTALYCIITTTTTQAGAYLYPLLVEVVAPIFFDEPLGDCLSDVPSDPLHTPRGSYCLFIRK
jgi:hypothetical protein